MFRNILIPVDFTSNTEVAINKAMELVDENFAILHLLHVEKPTNLYQSMIGLPRFPSFRKLSTGTHASDKLALLKEWIESTQPTIMAQTYLLPGGPVNQAILDVSQRIEPELIIIASKEDRPWFTINNSVFPNKIAKKTRCPVLTIKTGATQAPVKNILLPMGSFVPKRKIEWVSMLAKIYRARIHIVTMSNNDEFASSKMNKSFIETYRLLKKALPTPIEYQVLTGTSFARSVLAYAQKIKADLLLINPETESRISVFPSKHMNDMLSANSSLQILSLEPYAFENITPSFHGNN